MFYPPKNDVIRIGCGSIVVALVACLLCTPLYAQVTSGTIFGSVRDASGAAIQGATVTITEPSVGVTRTVPSSDAGQFSAPGLPPGTYNIKVESQGFKTLETTGITLSAADKLNAGEFKLEIGAVAQTVNVIADAGQVQLQSNSGERSDLITSRQLSDVAMNGRNVLDYIKLIPGVNSTSGLADLHVSSNIGQLGNFSINGSRQNQHEYTIDGASNVDTGNNGGTHVTINTDAIEELKILTSNYQAEFGKAAGGQLAVTTKSGTNEWHGNARFFHRHEQFNANEYFNKKNELSGGNPNEPLLYRYNDIGYQLGGPISKNKLFVFWSQEFYRQFVPLTGANASSQFYTPTLLERQGDFSQSVDGNGNALTISGPGITNNKIDPAQLPAAMQPVFAQMQKILNLYPKPNVSGFGVGGQNYNFSQALSGAAPRREEILRVDLQLNSKNRLFGRWVQNTENDQYPFLPFPGPSGSGFACSSPINFPGGCAVSQPSWNASVNLVSTITPTILNEFSVGPSHAKATASGVNGNVSRGVNGITLPLLYPVTSDQAIPDISFGGLNNVNFQNPYLGATPWHQANTTINLNDNLSWVHRNHTFKTGIFYQRSRKDQISWGNINGQMSFNVGTYTFNGNTYNVGDPFAAALLGFFQSFDQSTARPTGYFRYNQLEFYLQDTWKATSRLTLDYGVRFAWIPPQYDDKNQVALFVPSAYDPAKAVKIDPSSGQIIPGTGDPLNGMQYANKGQIPQGGWQSRGIMPEPRLGFAFDPYSNHKTVLRGGFGMSHDRAQGNLIFNTVFNNPAVVQTPQVAANNLAGLPSLSGTNTSVQGDKNIIGADRDGHVPTVYSFGLGAQHEITQGTTVDVAYVGSLSRHLITS